MSRCASIGVLPACRAPLASAGGRGAGCGATGGYRHVAKIGLELVGDGSAEGAAKVEWKALGGRGPADVDQRFGSPRNVYRESSTGREVRTHAVAADLPGSARWVVERSDGRVEASSHARDNPDIGKAKARVRRPDERLRGMTPEPVRATGIAGKLLLGSAPRNLNRVPGGRAAPNSGRCSARRGVDDDDVNFLRLGGRAVGPRVARDRAESFPGAPFSPDERHLRRLAMVLAAEQRRAPQE
jgi:hypothetical protein